MVLASWLLLLPFLEACIAFRGALSLSRACSRLPNGPQTAETMKPILLTLLVRRVDDPHPYYRRVRISLSAARTPPAITLMRQLTDSLASHLNVSNIERIVLNDLIVLTNDADLLVLDCDDRLEVFYWGCGPPTRAPTLLSTVEGMRSVGPTTTPCLRESELASTSYILLFTIRSGVGTPIRSAYNAMSGNASTPVFASADVAGDADQPPMFRSDALDSLDELRARLRRREILLVVYNDSGAPALRLTFDVDGAPRPLTRHGWFSQARLISSWPVATVVARPEFNAFSIEGESGSQRRFYVSYNSGGCTSATGLLVVNDVADSCEYAAFTAAPSIVYTTSSDGSWSRGGKQGRRISIFAR